jgi:hypothetical protein
MKISEISTDLIGKKVSVINTGLRVNGVITGIIDDEHCKGVKVKHEPVQWGEDNFTVLHSLARKCDGWGNLEYTKLI